MGKIRIHPIYWNPHLAILNLPVKPSKITLPPRWSPIFLFILALLIRVPFILSYHFDGLYGQDSFAYFNQAIGIAETLTRGHLPPLDFFWPNGYPLLAAVFMWVLGKTEIAALLPVLLTGAALAPLAYLLSLEFFGEHGPRAGWLAGLIIAFAGQPILSSATSMADAPGLFWAMLAVWCLARAWKAQENLWALTFAGFFLALATVTRWNYAMLALPFAVYALYQTRKHRTPLRTLLLPTIVGVVILLAQVWVSSHRPEGMFHQWLVGWRPGNFWRSSFQTPDGLQTFERPVWFFNLLPGIHPAYLFTLLGLAIPVGVWCTWRVRNWGALILLGGWFALTYAFLAGIPYENFRFGLAMYPPLVLFAAYGLVSVKDYAIQNTRNGLHKVIHLSYGILIAGSLLFMLGWAYRMMGSFLTTQIASKNQALNIAAQLPANATLITLGPTLILEHYTDLNVVEFFSTNEEGLKNLLFPSSSSHLYLLLDLQSMDTRWVGLSPYQNYHWLQIHTELNFIAEYPPYSLLEIIPIAP